MKVVTKHFSCLAVSYYTSEREADEAGEIVGQRGDTYHGGFFDGLACGREAGRDVDDSEHGTLYAVTHSGSAPVLTSDELFEETTI